MFVILMLTCKWKGIALISSQFDLFLFDLDGVVYVGSEPLPGAVESLERLRQENKSIRFLTNDPCATRESACARLHRLGITVETHEMITSSYATAQYMKDQGITSAIVLSDRHLQQECLKVGIEVNTVEHPEAVVVGWDGQITLHEIQIAAQLITKGSAFIATSPDLTFPTREGPALATGSLVEMLKQATQVRPIIVGKPNTAMFQAAFQSCPSISKDRVVMIGDNPLTDIVGAHQFGISSILISETNTNPFPVKDDMRNPDAIIPNLKSLFKQDVQVTKWTKQDSVWPEEVKPAVTAVVFNQDGYVLFMRRKDNDQWGLPTGRVEIGESVEQAVVREVQEETGLEVKVKKLIGVYSDPAVQTFVYPNGQVVHFITTCFECEIIGGAIKKETEEAQDVRFFSPNQLPKNTLPMHVKRMNEIVASRDE